MIAQAVLAVAALALLFGGLFLAFRALGGWIARAVPTDSLDVHSTWQGNGA